MEALDIRKAYLPINKYSRAQYPIYPIGLMIHYPDWAGISAMGLRDYFARLAETHEQIASVNWTIDEREIIQLMPINEASHHGGTPDVGNYTDFAWRYFKRGEDKVPLPYKYLYGVEVCHPDTTGKWPKKTLYNLMRLAAYVCTMHDWDPESNRRLITHNMVTGAMCPKYWVKHPGELERFRKAVKEYLVGEQEREIFHHTDYDI